MSLKIPTEIKYIDEVFLTDFEEACFLYALLPYINIEHKAEDPAFAAFEKSLLNYLLRLRVPRSADKSLDSTDFFVLLNVYKNNEILNQDRRDKFIKELESPTYKKDPRYNSHHFESEAPQPGHDPINYYYLRKIATNEALFMSFQHLLDQATLKDSKEPAQLLTHSSAANADPQTLIQARILALMKKMLEHTKNSPYTHVNDENILYNNFYDKDRGSPDHTLSHRLFALFVIIVNMNMFTPFLPYILAPYLPLPKVAILGIIVAATLMFDFFVVPGVSRALDPDFDKKMQQYQADWNFDHIKGHMNRVASDFDKSIVSAKNNDNIDTKKFQASQYYTIADAGRRAGTRTFLSQYTVGAPTIIKNKEPKDMMYAGTINVTLIKNPVIS